MKSFQLNFQQAQGVITYCIGAISSLLFQNPIASLITVLGIIIFIIGSKVNKLFLLAIPLWLIGSAFKIMHWPGASVLLYTGLLLLLTGLVWEVARTQQITPDLVPVVVSLGIIGVAYLLKFFHLPYVSIVTLTGCVSLIVTYSIRLNQKTTKPWDQLLKILIVYSWSVSTILAAYMFSYFVIISMFTNLLALLWAGLSLKKLMDLNANEAS